MWSVMKNFVLPCSSRWLIRQWLHLFCRLIKERDNVNWRQRHKTMKAMWKLSTMNFRLQKSTYNLNLFFSFWRGGGEREEWIRCVHSREKHCREAFWTKWKESSSQTKPIEIIWHHKINKNKKCTKNKASPEWQRIASSTAWLAYSDQKWAIRAVEIPQQFFGFLTAVWQLAMEPWFPCVFLWKIDLLRMKKKKKATSPKKIHKHQFWKHCM